MAEETILVPDLGDSDEVEVIEVLVSPGDEISENDSLVVLESDKAAMEIPATASGKVAELLVKVGDKVSQGTPLLKLEGDGATEEDEKAADEPEQESKQEQEDADREESGKTSDEGAAEDDSEKDAPKEDASAASGGTSSMEVPVPDLGGDENVEVIDVLVAVGDEVEKETGLVTLESDKAAMDVPSPAAGKVTAIKVNVGDKVSEGSLILELEVSGGEAEPAKEKPSATPAPSPAPAASSDEHVLTAEEAEASDSATHDLPEPTAEIEKSSLAEVYAGPAVRKLARELGVDLTRVKGTGTRDRILKEDVHAFVKQRMTAEPEAASAGGSGIPGIPDTDFSQFGETEEVEMSKLHQITAQNMSRNWLNVPHVTQFDKADVTDLEEFRAAKKALAEKKGIKLTPVPFIIKACAKALQEHPQFNVSIHSSGTKLIQKKYVHIGFAVATPAGLMVPVIHDVDRKSIWELAAEIAELGNKAKERRLTKEQMQGACFTVSSLGALGGTGFTPIVSAPEVAILGVSKTAIEPVYKDGEFVPRKMMPFSLSYDHRAVNGVDGGQFCTYLSEVLSDIRMLAL